MEQKCRKGMNTKKTKMKNSISYQNVLTQSHHKSSERDHLSQLSQTSELASGAGAVCSTQRVRCLVLDRAQK